MSDANGTTNVWTIWKDLDWQIKLVFGIHLYVYTCLHLYVDSGNELEIGFQKTCRNKMRIVNVGVVMMRGIWNENLDDKKKTRHEQDLNLRGETPLDF